jgi:Domain of unknown function (DUF6265)
LSKPLLSPPHYSLRMLKRVVVGVWTGVLIAGAAAAQDRPDFSGTWTAVTEPAPASPTGRPAPPVWGPQFTIDQKGTALTLTRSFTGAGQATIKFVLDGSETTSRMPGRLCEADSGATWTAAWDGNAVAIAMVGAMPPNGKAVKMDVRSTLTLEAADALRVEVTARVPNQPAPRVTSTAYRRAAAAPAPDAPSATAAKATMAQVAWITGTWSGTSASGTTFEERWTPSAGGSMIGVARTLRDGLMSAFEFLCIVERNGGLVYQAMPNGRSPATDFTLTSVDETSAVFENPAHDFPKMIRYAKRPDGSLEAVVSGAPGSKPLTYVFKKQE